MGFYLFVALFSSSPFFASNPSKYFVPIVRLVNDNPEDTRLNGSGSLLDKDTVLSSAHVFGDGNIAKRRIDCDGKLIGFSQAYLNTDNDIAILKLESSCTAIKKMPLAKKNAPTGAPIYAIGCPDAMCGLITKGIISGYQARESMTIFYSDVKAWHGSSGGPVLNEDGEIVGVVMAMHTMKEYHRSGNAIEEYGEIFTVCVPVSEIRQFLAQLGKP